jgi:hypothetical protein
VPHPSRRLLIAAACVLPITVRSALFGAGQVTVPPIDWQKKADSLPIAPLSTSDQIVYLLTNVPGVHQGVRTAIRDSASWRAFWSQATLAGQPGGGHPALPTIDFSKYMLLVASDGFLNSGSTIAITRVDGRRDSLVAAIRVRTGVMPRCRETAAYAPMAVVRVPRDNRPVMFVEQTVDEQCGFTDPRPAGSGAPAGSHSGR